MLFTYINVRGGNVTNIKVKQWYSEWVITRTKQKLLANTTQTFMYRATRGGNVTNRKVKQGYNERTITRTKWKLLVNTTQTLCIQLPVLETSNVNKLIYKQNYKWNFKQEVDYSDLWTDFLLHYVSVCSKCGYK